MIVELPQLFCRGCLTPGSRRLFKWNYESGQQNLKSRRLVILSIINIPADSISQIFLSSGQIFSGISQNVPQDFKKI